MPWASGVGVRPSKAWPALSGSGAAWPAEVWSGVARPDDLSTEGLRAFPAGFYELRSGTEMPVIAGSVRARRGGAKQGQVACGTGTSYDSSTGGFGSLCCSLWGADAVCSGAARCGALGTGLAMSDEAGLAAATLISALSPTGLSAGFIESRHGTERLG
jgi:hypothetical protein